jgi:hypothetical protein
VPLNSTIITSVFLPASVAINYNVLTLTRNKALFSLEVYIFQPKRFLTPECNDKTRSKHLYTLDILFNRGRWMCLGKTVVLYKINKVIFKISLTFLPALLKSADFLLHIADITLWLLSH